MCLLAAAAAWQKGHQRCLGFRPSVSTRLNLACHALSLTWVIVQYADDVLHEGVCEFNAVCLVNDPVCVLTKKGHPLQADAQTDKNIIWVCRLLRPLDSNPRRCCLLVFIYGFYFCMGCANEGCTNEGCTNKGCRKLVMLLACVCQLLLTDTH